MCRSDTHVVISALPETPEPQEPPKAPETQEPPKPPEALETQEPPKTLEAPETQETLEALEAPEAQETQEALEAPEAPEVPGSKYLAATLIRHTPTQIFGLGHRAIRPGHH
jgi:hypothetical protein